MDGWRTDIGYPEDRDEDERRLLEVDESLAEEASSGSETDATAE